MTKCVEMIVINMCLISRSCESKSTNSIIV